VVGTHVPALDLAQLVGTQRPGIVALSASAAADADALRGDLAVMASAAAAARSRLVVCGAGFAKLAKLPSAVTRHHAIEEIEATT
jgi:hypothetical protein